MNSCRICGETNDLSRLPLFMELLTWTDNGPLWLCRACLGDLAVTLNKWAEDRLQHKADLLEMEQLGQVLKRGMGELE